MKPWMLGGGLVLLLAAVPARAADEKPAEKQPAEKQPAKFEVPYRLTDSQHVLVRVKLNGKGPFNFILDTGAPALILSEKVAKKVGLETDRNGWGTFDRLELEGGLVVPKAKGLATEMFQLKGMNALGLAGVELHGVLGYTILARYRIQYDFTTDKLVWEPLDFEPPKMSRIGKGGSQGGLEVMGDIMAVMGGLLGIKPNFEKKPRGFLGVELDDSQGGVFVKSVLPGGPAAKGGLKAGDKIETIKGRDVDDIADVMRLVAKLGEGDKLKLTVKRGNDSKEIAVELGKGL